MLISVPIIRFHKNVQLSIIEQGDVRLDEKLVARELNECSKARVVMAHAH